MTSGSAHEHEGPLRDIRVLDASNVVAGPFASQILADFGADVIKVEHPERGDSLRLHGPSKDGVGLYWKTMGRGKRSVGLNLSHQEGAEIFVTLAKTCDVVIESFRPGVFESWGLSYERLKEANPGLILARVSGFGQKGPYAHRPAFGTLAEVMSGFAHLTGPADGPPTLPPFGLADSLAGLATVSAILMALRERDHKSQGGQVVDVSILEPILASMSFQTVWYDQLGIVESRRGNRSVNSAPRNTYLTKDDKWIAIAASTPKTAVRLFEMIGQGAVAEEPWFPSNAERAKRADIIDAHIAPWVRARTRDEVLSISDQYGVALAPVYDAADIAKDRHVNETDMIIDVPDADLGSIRMNNVLFRMSQSPGRIRFAGVDLGRDTDEILGQEVGLSSDRIAHLRQRGSIK